MTGTNQPVQGRYRAGTSFPLAFGSAGAAAVSQAARQAAVAKRLVDVEQLLIWAYMVQQVDRALLADTFEVDDLSMNRGHSRDGMAAVERFVELGGWVDDQAMGISFDAAADALAVHARISRLFDSETARLIRHHARDGSRPSWRGASGWAPKEWKRPYVAEFTEYDHNRNRCYAYCPIEWVERGESAGLARERYTTWYMALSRLAFHFVRHPYMLKRHQVTGFAAPGRPWSDSS